MKQTLVLVAVVLALIAGAYFYGRLGSTPDIDAIVEKHEAALRDTVANLNATLDTLLRSADAAEARVDTLVVRQRELVSTADMWAGEGVRTAVQLRAHLVELDDSIGVSVLDNYVAQRDQETTSLRDALFVADSARADLFMANDTLRVALWVSEEKFMASERARVAIVQELKARDRRKTLKNVAKVGGTFLAVFGICKAAPESVC